ncbi:type II secretion system F family protein [Taylorella equigenitalis]|uniref:Type II/IV secretion system protein TadC n=4 Tax=Taylorella equigenitalis TaxID=29575 RepID=A0A654KKG5_TAYEM|nr:type II secretion system F family protein [Taylorella equigenitalis]ADU92416.1 Type II/IV secretion system protein TadC [Taylorella equigenitalis MCE9]AFN35971.1 putative Flp pilus assembly protein [Taylorella equigenitalis ATCC 35865]ASY30604.1 type II/IV secretion system protein TadC [Taylorella equigenitalis]ASY37911.1 type II/IV secretion system protein TadC [Taylorella equigenitalis]ASY39379.1 type II/IV secretion system protein TadC [Taylorella equigenitalis]
MMWMSLTILLVLLSLAGLILLLVGDFSLDGLGKKIIKILGWQFGAGLNVSLAKSGLSTKWTPHKLVGLVAFVILFELVLVLWVILADLQILYLYILFIFIFITLLWPKAYIKRYISKRRTELSEIFPFFLDVLSVSLSSGQNFTMSLQYAFNSLPNGVLKDELGFTIREMQAGKPKLEAIDDMAQRSDLNVVKQWVNNIKQADQLGLQLASAFRAQASYIRKQRYLMAEKLAFEAPVKMLFPLVFFIFPCTFIVLLFPVFMQILESW